MDNAGAKNMLHFKVVTVAKAFYQPLPKRQVRAGFDLLFNTRAKSQRF
jgi:hypothetical protein